MGKTGRSAALDTLEACSDWTLLWWLVVNYRDNKADWIAGKPAPCSMLAFISALFQFNLVFIYKMFLLHVNQALTVSVVNDEVEACLYTIATQQMDSQCGAWRF